MKPLSAAIVGCGRIAGGYDLASGPSEVWSHAKAYRRDGRVRLVAAWDPDRSQLECFCEQWEVEHRATSLEDLLASASPDIVSRRTLTWLSSSWK